MIKLGKKKSYGIKRFAIYKLVRRETNFQQLNFCLINSQHVVVELLNSCEDRLGSENANNE